MTQTPVENLFILIVERQVGDMESVCASLQGKAFDYGFARTREDAIKIMTIKLYDYVIMDYAVPGMSAEEFWRVLQYNDSKAKIIFTYPATGPSPQVLMKNCQWLGVPFDTSDLLNLLN